jgi:CMD domain protein
MTTLTVDTVDALAGITPGSPLDDLRRQRPVTREQLQASYDALFTPPNDSAFSVTRRRLVAAFVTRVTADDATAHFYADAAHLADPERAPIVLAEASLAATTGPFGVYREAGLRGEDTEGRHYEPNAAVRDALGNALSAAIVHAHLLTVRPREAGADDHTRLLEAGWTVDGIVTLSQLISFLAFQQRVATGLRALAIRQEISA